ncbi:DSBA-like thioredoxin domain-containing protein [Vitreoscilla sp. C1]|uniref:DsbA family oxidoreductase n=1 Tax=Vitreoscilla sp. (strain C1) TaxID=96942 RepID=UPI000CDCAC64|nr:DsbA family oxidoreductase [Vitreoscilla sp. C1]AUZ04408.1 DSBA-like thioredoxin domain-containing protein [Vitreoscilla sp. C1]
MMKIEIWSDYVCPFCYIGKANLLQALTELQVEAEFVWRSFELDPTYPIDGPSHHYDVLQQKFQVSAEQAAEKCGQLAKIGESCGLKMDFEQAYYGNTFLAHQLQQYANSIGSEQGHAINQLLFDAVFNRGLNINHIDVLADLATEAGLNHTATQKALQSQAFATAVRVDEASGQELNITGVPFFGFDGRLAVAGAQSIDAFKEVIQHILNHDASEDAKLTRQ